MGETIHPGSVLARRYQVQRSLGAGGMGLIFEALDVEANSAVAIKIPRPEFAPCRELTELFHHEFRLGRLVSHPNVCRTLAFGEHDGLPFIVMDLIRGVALNELMVGVPEGLPGEAASHIVLDVAEGLAALHERDLVHGDLKPANVMIDVSTRRARLLDLGIAAPAGGALRVEFYGGPMIGTPEYASPEQCVGAQPDCRSDIFALGVILYELLTGEVPHRGSTALETLALRATALSPLDDPVPGILPPEFAPVIQWALQKDPARRFRSVRELIDAVSTAAISMSDAEPHRGAPERRRAARLDARFDCSLALLDEDDSVLFEQPAIAESLSSRGARVTTTLTGLHRGDPVLLRIGHGQIQARGEVVAFLAEPDRRERILVQFRDATGRGQARAHGDPPVPPSPSPIAPETPLVQPVRHREVLDPRMVRRLRRGPETGPD